MEELLKLIEESAVQLVMVEPSDLSGLADLHTHFAKIHQHAQQVDSAAARQVKLIQSACGEATDLLEKIIMAEVADTTAAIESLNETTKLMQRLASEITAGEHVGPGGSSDKSLADQADAAPEGTGASPNTPSLPANVDENIFREFLNSQPDVLASLEAAILAAEKDPSTENRDAVKAILHNLKGEAGLMGLQEVAASCHESESLLADNLKSFPAEKLLNAKDWLQNAIAQLSGQVNKDAVSADTDHETTAEQTDIAQQEDGTAKEPVPAEQGTTIAQADIPLVTDFISESNEHLESAEEDVLNLEDNTEDTEAVNSIFRAFHTIKGVAGFLNLQQIASLAHAAENLLDMARKGELRLGGASTDVVLESIDAMKQMLGALAEAAQSGQPIKSYEQLQTLLERIKTCVSGGAPAPRLGEALVRSGAVERSQVRQALNEQNQRQDKSKLGQILVEKGAATAQQVTQALQDQQTPKPARSTTARKAAGEGSIKVGTEKLDSLVTMVGELVIAQSMVNQDLDVHLEANQQLQRNVRLLDKITRELQELSMSLRMVPVQGVFQKMARLVRDLSRKAGKEIEFIISGGETELDRNVVEAIADPLVHMVRNSVDHGVELPDERVKNGKKRTGRVELRAFHQGGNIVIEIADDGKGLDRERILQKARANGLVKEEQELPDQEVYRLIFHAGLSTAEKVTDISGRGVGMDVVRKNIEALRGRVDIDSTPGQGSTFTIRLPLTLAVIDGQVITVGKETFIIPLLSIEQNLRPDKEQLSTVQGGRAEMVMVRGQLLPLVRLYALFDIETQSIDPSAALVVVVTDGQRRCCLLVDDLEGQQQVVIKSLSDSLGSLAGISGGAIMGDGHVALILDVPGLIDLAGQD